MKRYLPSEIENKWRLRWSEEGIYKFNSAKEQDVFYNLVELPYTSGDLHIGHWFAFAPADALARFKRMQGLNVFFPNGFDAFGLPAENAAIKRGVNPKDWTLANIQTMRQQFDTMGTMIDWDHQVITCLPEYYKWNQWIFIKMFEKGLAYLDKALLNWCPVDQTVLADENVVDGKCWRCGTEVVKREVDEWFLKITEYAEDLIWPDNPSVDWPKSVREGQNNWIGKSEGLIINFDGIEVFTTRPETADGATFLVLAPEHPLMKNLITPDQKDDVESYIKSVKNKTEQERKENKGKTGVFTGSFVKNPVTNQDIPVWLADYVLLGYGTGAIMAVPSADERDKEFAEKFNLPIIETKLNAGPKGEKTVNFHLHDWSISRQRYWGTPVPMIHCPKCGIVAVPLEDLPVELPSDVDFTPKGKAPLASNEQWLRVKCPKCQGEASRDPQTLDGFFDNSWYFFRYMDPEYQNGPFESGLAKKLMPVDIYFGGAEHTLGHTLYSRFFTKFFKDLGLIDFSEYALRRVQHGVVLGPDGNRMSKSKGNVINPDDVVKEYGTDTVRVYLCFMMPYEDTVAPWSPDAVSGIYRFLRRVWDLSEKVSEVEPDAKDLNMMHKTIKKVGDDIENIKFNTAIAGLMTWLNHLSAKDGISQAEFSTFLLLLAPFAPHICEELWETIGGEFSIHQQSWPKYDQKYLEDETYQVAVQINGKVRETLLVPSSLVDNQSEVENLALKSDKVSKYLNSNPPKKVIYIKGKILSLVV